jgi:hypothetical protein
LPRLATLASSNASPVRSPGFEAQQDAVSVLFNAKINANPENTVGVMTMGGFNGKGCGHLCLLSGRALSAGRRTV